MKQIFSIIFLLLGIHIQANAEVIQGKYSGKTLPTQDIQQTVYELKTGRSFVTTFERARKFIQVDRTVESRIQCTISGPSVPLNNPEIINKIKIIMELNGVETEIAVPAYNTGYGTMDILSIDFDCSEGALSGYYKFVTPYGSVGQDNPEFQISIPAFAD